MKENSKAHIIQVALQLFQDKGMNNVSLNEVIKSSGLSKGAFYHHFSNKRALTIASVISYWHNMSSEILNAPIDQMPLKEVFEMIIEQMNQVFHQLEDGNENFFELYISMLSFVREEPDILKISKKYFETFNAKLITSIKNDQEKGILNPTIPAKDSALLIATCAEGHGLLSFAKIHDKPTENLRKILNQIYNSLVL